MKNKILFISTEDYSLPDMKICKEMGWEVHIATPTQIRHSFADKHFKLSIKRSFQSYKQLKQLIQKNKYNLIHCHASYGGLIGRSAAKKARKRGTKVIYSTFSFPFYKGAPLRKWLIYYPIEKYLSRYTDTLITSNTEDYDLSFTRKFKAKLIELTHGIGIDTKTYKPLKEEEKMERKEAFGLRADDFLIVYAANFTKENNHKFLLDVVALIRFSLLNVKLLLAGDGPLLKDCLEYAKELKIEDHVDFLGQRDDLHNIFSICDVAVSSSISYSLPINTMKAMACGLPVVAVKNKGLREVVQNNKVGWLIKEGDIAAFASKIRALSFSEIVREKFGENGLEMMREYSFSKVKKELQSNYDMENHESVKAYLRALL